MLHEDPEVTAVQAVNDVVAVGCAETLLGKGLKVPEDMSVAGFGGILLGRHFRVPLTYRASPSSASARPPWNSCSNCWSANAAVLLWPAELVIRASTDKPPIKHAKSR